MVLLSILLLYLLLTANIVYYELRVLKGLNQEPKYITPKYVQLLLLRKYDQVKEKV